MTKFNTHICKRITEEITDKKYDVNCAESVKVCYALETLVDELEKMLILLLLFCAIGYIKEFFLIMFTISVTRCFMGGMHFKTWQGCMTMTITVYCISVFCGHFLRISSNKAIIIFAIYGLLMMLVAPISSANRPQYRGKMRLKMKLKGLVGFILSIILYFKLKSYSGYIISVLLLEIIEVAVVLIVRYISQNKFSLCEKERRKYENGECKN